MTCGCFFADVLRAGTGDKSLLFSPPALTENRQYTILYIDGDTVLNTFFAADTDRIKLPENDEGARDTKTAAKYRVYI